jgi:MOSC domain-containing protein YiiM
VGVAGATLGIVSVNAGTPSRLGVRSNGSVVYSAIAKRPVPGDSVWLDWQNLSGDRQGDTRVHGGVDKAVYCYSGDHFAAWAAELGRPVEAAAFGENLTVSGATEASVCIGDVWRWGDAVVQVAQPRYPCFKVAMHTRVKDMEARFVASGRSGWYLRVLRPGEVPARGDIVVEQRDPAGLSVLDAHWAFSSDQPEDIARIQPLLALDTLADSWKRMLRRRVRIVENRAS